MPSGLLWLLVVSYRNQLEKLPYPNTNRYPTVISPIQGVRCDHCDVMIREGVSLLAHVSSERHAVSAYGSPRFHKPHLITHQLIFPIWCVCMRV